LEAGANILHADQHSTDPSGGEFFLRLEFTLPPGVDPDALRTAFGKGVAEPFVMQWSLWDTSARKRVAILVSKYDHALQELLWRWRRAELNADVVLVASNHEDLRGEVENLGLAYHHVPVTADGGKAASEAALLELLSGVQPDLVVLARYMQILSGDFLEQVGAPVINIHHSFLPAFIGAAPYRKAKERGVKLIGATSHYVTKDLDEGPIIEQDVARVNHAMDAADLQSRGAYVERAVLSRAVQWHAQDRVIRHGNQTIVFTDRP